LRFFFTGRDLSLLILLRTGFKTVAFFFGSDLDSSVSTRSGFVFTSLTFRDFNFCGGSFLMLGFLSTLASSFLSPVSEPELLESELLLPLSLSLSLLLEPSSELLSLESLSLESLLEEEADFRLFLGRLSFLMAGMADH
jgi:hypothetical protein